MKKTIFLSLSLFALLFFAQIDVFACGCPGLGKNPSDEIIASAIAKEFKASSNVFSGKVIAAQYVPITENVEGVKSKVEALVYKFKVDARWKGDVEGEIIIPTSVRRYADGSGSAGSNCIHSYFKVEEQYLVYAFGTTDKLQASVCGRTNLIVNAERDIKELQLLKAEPQEKSKDNN